MKIGILLCGRSPDSVVEEFGEYDLLFIALLKERGFTFENFDVVDMNFPENVHSADGWIVSGSRHGVYEEHEFIEPLETFIRDAYQKAVPLVGICFGHQIVAQALGGRVEKFKGGWSVGEVEYQFTSQSHKLNDTTPLRLVAWHQDQVIDPPKDAEVLAGNDFCKNAVLIYGDRAFTMQPHPEFSEDFFHALYRERHMNLPDDYRVQIEKPTERKLGRARAADMIEGFFRSRKI